ncbi:MAG: NAD(P)H-hydrate dehydratase [Oscillospiraceae bacterium]
MEQERKVEPIGRELVRRLLPRRDPEGHKGTFGKVLCLCGSVGYTGAPVFASRGAVRSGAGLVFLGVPESIWPVAAVKSDEAMPFPCRRRREGCPCWRRRLSGGVRRAATPCCWAAVWAGAGRRMRWCGG